MTATIKNKVFHCKQTAKSIELNQEHSLNDDKHPCNCKSSNFCGADHDKIITGGKPQSLIYSRCKKEIDRAIEKYDGNLKWKYKLEYMDLRVSQVKKVKNKIKSLKKSK